MNSRKRIPVLALLVAVLIAASATVQAYERYDGGNACVQCHDGFVGGFGAPLHDAHNSLTNCSDCHDTIGDNPLIQNCTNCHISDQLKNAHNQAPADQMGFNCATCHTFVPNDAFSWGETKALFTEQ